MHIFACYVYDTATLLRICSLSDTAILKAVKDDTDNYPVIGDARQLDITMLHRSTDQHYLIRIRQNRERCKKTCFEVLEVLVRPDKPYVFDCLNLERYIICVCVCVCACMRACVRVRMHALLFLQLTVITIDGIRSAFVGGLASKCCH